MSLVERDLVVRVGAVVRVRSSISISSSIVVVDDGVVAVSGVSLARPLLEAAEDGHGVGAVVLREELGGVDGEGAVHAVEVDLLGHGQGVEAVLEVRVRYVHGVLDALGLVLGASAHINKDGIAGLGRAASVSAVHVVDGDGLVIRGLLLLNRTLPHGSQGSAHGEVDHEGELGLAFIDEDVADLCVCRSVRGREGRREKERQ